MLNYISNSTSAEAGVAVFAVIMVVLYVAMIGFGLYMYWRIAGKAGWPGWYSLGLVVPVLNLVLMVMFAFKEWPVETENRVMRQQLDFSGYGGFPSGLAQAPGQSASYGTYPASQPGYTPPVPGQTWHHPDV